MSSFQSSWFAQFAVAALLVSLLESASGEDPAAKDPAKNDSLSSKKTTIGTKSKLVGGPGGHDFEYVIPKGTDLIGFRIGVKEPLGSIQPIYGQRKKKELGPRLGKGGERFEDLIAKPGYRVSQIALRADDFVYAISVKFVSKSSSKRWYSSKWVGNAKAGKQTTLGDDKYNVIGIYGRGTALVDALGLIGLKKGVRRR